MMRKSVAVVVGAAFLAVVGCEGAPLITRVTDTDRSLVVGFIDMRDAPSELEWVTFKQVFPRVDPPYWRGEAKGGVFYHILPRGAYVVYSFGGAARNPFMGSSSYAYKMPPYGGAATRFKIDRAGAVYFLGSYRFVMGESPGFFSTAKFDIVPAGGPPEADILKYLLSDAVGTYWEGVIKRRLEGTR